MGAAAPAPSQAPQEGQRRPRGAAREKGRGRRARRGRGRTGSSGRAGGGRVGGFGVRAAARAERRVRGHGGGGRRGAARGRGAGARGSAGRDRAGGAVCARGARRRCGPDPPAALPGTNRTHMSHLPGTNRTHMSHLPGTNRTHMSHLPGTNRTHISSPPWTNRANSPPAAGALPGRDGAARAAAALSPRDAAGRAAGPCVGAWTPRYVAARGGAGVLHAGVHVSAAPTVDLAGHRRQARARPGARSRLPEARRRDARARGGRPGTPKNFHFCEMSFAECAPRPAPPHHAPRAAADGRARGADSYSDAPLRPSLSCLRIPRAWRRASRSTFAASRRAPTPLVERPTCPTLSPDWRATCGCPRVWRTTRATTTPRCCACRRGTPPLRTNRTRRVLHPVLIGHAASFTPY